MARKKNGKWHGVTGNLSFYDRMGVEVMRTTPKTKKKISPAFAEAQRHFAYVLSLVMKFKAVTDIGYKDFDPAKTPYNVAMSRNLNKYKLARRDNKTENLSWFEFSSGELSSALAIEASVDHSGVLNISWSGTEEWTTQFDNDNLVTVVYNVTKDKLLVIKGESVRKDGMSALILENMDAGDVLEVFIMFHVHQYKYKSGSKTNVSNSKWIGQFTIPTA